MAMKDWFKRRTAPKTIGKTEGGSRILAYGEAPSPQVGFLAESTLGHMQERERVYAELFGESDTVFHELLPRIPHIDIYRFPPNEQRDFFTYVTGGLSDLPMNSPDELGARYRRAELVFYASEHRDDYPELLRWLSHFVHDNSTWLHWGHSLPNGQPPSPLFDTENLDSLFFIPTIVRPDSTLGEKLRIDDDPVNLVWCVPITTAECQLKLDQGAEALCDLFDANQHSPIFRGNRDSYV